MIRVVWFSLLVPFAIVLLWDDAPDLVIQVAFFGALGLIVLGLLTNRLALTCRYCGKRMKLGSSHCHHCGRQVTDPRPIGAPSQQSTAMVRDYWEPHEISRECDYCKTEIRPDASVCPQCRRDLVPWVLKDNTWWRQDGAAWLWLDLHAKHPTWRPYEESPIVRAGS